MMKKSLKKAVALIASIAMAVGAVPAIGASAKSNDVYTSTYVWYNAKTELYYDTKEEAIDASSAADVYHGYAINTNYRVNFSPLYPYYSTYTKKYYPSFFAATAVSKGDESKVIFGGPDGSATYDINHPYYSTYTRRYYSTYSEALAHSANNSSYVIKTDKVISVSSGTVYAYYSTYTKKYYVSYSDALAASRGVASYVKKVDYDITNSAGDYYNSMTGQWYSTLAAALSASNNNADYVYYTGGTFTVYDYNGKSYASEADAKAAGAGDNAVAHSYTGRYIPSSAYNTTVYYNTTGYYNGYYYYGYPYYYGYYYYGYPYYYYSVNTTTKAGEGVPYLKGHSTKHSWSNLASYVKNCKSGSVVEITMNGATTVSDTFMSALKGRNVTVVFYMDNGIKWTVKGTNVTSATTANLTVSYGADNIPDKLVKKATANAITAAAVSVGTGTDSLGFKGNCTIKFSSDRANQFAKTYLYDEEDNTLTLVSKSMTDDNGYVSFTASKNGTYLVVLS